jgi:hypothetical protein
MEPDETTIKDGSHSLCVYKCEDGDQLRDPSLYLPLPSRLSDIKQSDFNLIVPRGGFLRSQKESITIRTRLCSTKLTQNGEKNISTSPKRNITKMFHCSPSHVATQLEVKS